MSIEVVSGTQGSTAEGADYWQTDLTVSGEPARLLTPGTNPTALVIFCHGATDTQTTFMGPWMLPFTEGAITNGWAIGSVRTNESKKFGFGNQASLDLIAEFHDWASPAASRGTVLHGHSMGGMTVYNLVSNNMIPDLLGAFIVNGTVDSLASNSLSTIRRLYGASDNEELLINQAGYDPARDDPSRWANRQMFLSYSTTDSAIPYGSHGRVFYDRAATPSFIRLHVGTHGHHDGFLHREVLEWAGGLINPTAVKPFAYQTNGSPVYLYDTSGHLVSHR